jgi:hypothetical protein
VTHVAEHPSDIYAEPHSRRRRPTLGGHPRQHLVPADFRLYLTATPRILAAPRPQKDKNGQELEIASMASDPDGTYGAWIYELGLVEAIERGILAGFEIDVLEIRDPQPRSGCRRRRCGAGAWRCCRPPCWSTRPRTTSAR